MKPAYPYALPFDRYRKLTAEEYARLLELSESAVADGRLDAAIPGCPDWDIEQLIRHTALVYLQKAETIRTGVKPTGRWVPEDILALEPVALLELCYGRLTSEFDSHAPSDPAESWVADDQTVGFWIRRLTHETAIHRYDVEAALGKPEPIRAELAVDGIDEILTVMLERTARPTGDTGGTVELAAGAHVWTVHLLPDDMTITREESSARDARIAGEPSDVLLWLWGREPLPPGQAGQPAAAELRRRLAAAT